jgi:hypothetical protein
VQIPLSGFDAEMYQQVLDVAEINAFLQQVGGKAMAKHMETDLLLNASPLYNSEMLGTSGRRAESWQ